MRLCVCNLYFIAAPANSKTTKTKKLSKKKGSDCDFGLLLRLLLLLLLEVLATAHMRTQNEPNVCLFELAVPYRKLPFRFYYLVLLYTFKKNVYKK